MAWVASMSGFDELEETLRLIRDKEVSAQERELVLKDKLTITWATLRPLINKSVSDLRAVLSRYGFNSGPFLHEAEFRADGSSLILRTYITIHTPRTYGYIAFVVSIDPSGCPTLHVGYGNEGESWRDGYSTPAAMASSDEILDAIAEITADIVQSGYERWSE